MCRQRKTKRRDTFGIRQFLQANFRRSLTKKKQTIAYFALKIAENCFEFISQVL